MGLDVFELPVCSLIFLSNILGVFIFICRLAGDAAYIWQHVQFVEIILRRGYAFTRGQRMQMLLSLVAISIRLLSSLCRHETSATRKRKLVTAQLYSNVLTLAAECFRVSPFPKADGHSQFPLEWIISCIMFLGARRLLHP